MKRILVVEDQDDIRELIRMTLELEDYDIDEAPNGDLGFKKAKSYKPDLILLDVMMPGGMDGIAVCKALRADTTFRNTKIVMLTAKGQDADKAVGMAAGADEYLIKPFSPMQVIKLVNRLLG